jgi:anhydro-N-acetylmuramic acid kinase
MSGTSHDGISAALVRIDGGAPQPVKLLGFRTYPYSGALRGALLRASSGAALEAVELAQLNFRLGARLGRAALALLRAVAFPARRLSFIGSHGHTVAHQPPGSAGRGRPLAGATLQIGEPAVIAAMTGVAVVADFRPMDVALGGQGAPLVPAVHRMLFGDARRGRVVQNIGGIANATYLPPRTTPAPMVAFDTGPGVMLIDALAARLTNGKQRMDRDGRLAARGRVVPALLEWLMRHPYLRKKPPKTTGRETFGAAYLERVVARARRDAVSDYDLAATLTAFSAASIADAVRRFIIARGPADEVVVTGGGARNPTLMRMLKAELGDIPLIRAALLGVDGDALEAVAFAILGYLALRGLPGNVPAATGARLPAVLGKLTLPPSGLAD